MISFKVRLNEYRYASSNKFIDKNRIKRFNLKIMMWIMWLTNLKLKIKSPRWFVVKCENFDLNN